MLMFRKLTTAAMTATRAALSTESLSKTPSEKEKDPMIEAVRTVASWGKSSVLPPVFPEAPEDVQIAEALKRVDAQRPKRK